MVGWHGWYSCCTDLSGTAVCLAGPSSKSICLLGVCVCVCGGFVALFVEITEIYNVCLQSRHVCGPYEA